MIGAGDVMLEARGISKSFPGVQALDRVGMTLRRGRLTALLGENGAGKSTLMNIIAGVLPPDTGELLVEGRPVRFANPRQARDHGIAMIFQELNLVPGLSVAENIFLGREPLRRGGLIDYGALNRDAAAWLERLDLTCRRRRRSGACASASSRSLRSPRHWLVRSESSSWTSLPRRSRNARKPCCSSGSLL